MADYQSGSAWIPVKPDFKGFHKSIAAEFGKLTPVVRKLGQDMGARFADGVRGGLGAPVQDAVREDTAAQRRQAPRDAAQVASAFAGGLKRTLRGELQAMPRATVTVEADTAAARTSLASTRAQVDRLDGRTARVNVDAAPAIAGFGALAIAAGAAAAVPVGATLAAGLGALSAPLAAAGAGFGALGLVAVPAITGISEALKLQEQAANGSAAAAEQYAAALAEMSPAARTLMGDWQGLTREFTAWRKSVEAPVLGIFSDGINLLSGRFESLTPLVRSSAGAVRGLISDMDAALSSPFWEQLGRDVTAAAPGAITSFGRIGGSVATGLAGIVSAFLPYAPTILGFVEDIAAGFASWGKGLGGSPAFAAFLEYVREVAPSVRDLFKSLGPAVANVLTALAPLGPVVLKVATAFADMIAAVPPGVITALAGALLAVGVAIKVVAAGSALAAIANPVGLIVVGIVALVAALVWAYHRFDAFREIVQSAFAAISRAAQWVWANFLQPIFASLVEAIQTHIIPAVMKMWRDVFLPAFREIGAVVQWAWQNVIQPALLLYVQYVQKILIPAVLFLWKWVIVPAFYAIATVIGFVWTTIIKPVFKVLWWTIKNVLIPVVLFLWRNVIVPAWKGIAAAVKFAWNTIIKPIWAGIRAYINKVLRPVFMFLWRKVIMPVWKGIRLAISVAWALIKKIWAGIRAYIRGVLAPVFRWIWNNVIKPAWRGIGNTIKWVWNKVIRPAFNSLKSGVQAVRKAFGSAVDGIKKAWARIKAATKGPINFVIQTVYMDGIRSLAGKVLGAVGVKKNPLPSFSKIATGGVWEGPGQVARYAGGGVMPGYTPGRDVHRFVSPTGGGLELSGGEAILRPEVTRVLGASMIHDVNALARQGGTTAVKRRFEQSQGFARGGVWQAPTQSFARGGIMSALSNSWDWVEGKADQISGAAKKWFLDKLGLDSLLGAIPDGGFMTRFAKGLFRELLVPKIGDLVNKKDEEFGGSSDAVVRVAMKYAKNPGLVGGDFNNKFQRAFGMAGQPWCAMFVSEVIKEAKASKKYNNIWGAHSRSFRDGLPHGSASNAKPGWIATYGSEPSHINIIAKRKGGQNYTIGGNESNAVRGPRVYGPATDIMKPKFARGGVVDPRVLRQDYGTNRRTTTPVQTQFLRSAFGLPAYAAGGWVRGWGGLDRNLIAATAGEFVVREPVARDNAALLEALNSGQQLSDILAATGGPRGMSATQQQALAAVARRASESGGGVSAELHLHNGEATVREAFRQLNYESSKLQLGGKYRR
ncbi:phage tail protein [Streptomonospora wellingtoniae]|uniref:Uncharacterized protein n=1 Tax=Streptomonospora wellingtoniae TaxID=3075544 RepID=A0ABU2KUC3_9ACTN|nr:hypothetical protein [Streptomonospora sp. DSM 45055]MDT0302896.1 hypothetical protein [Streptomonospora sp. DSM 45055]